MQYLTYEEYVTLGGTLDTAAFNRKITRVCGIVTNATSDRIKPLYGIPKEVKELCRDLIDFLSQQEESGNVQSRSQSAGGVSESISYAVGTDKSCGEQIDRMIYDYLANVTTADGVSVLYRGCSY